MRPEPQAGGRTLPAGVGGAGLSPRPRPCRTRAARCRRGSGAAAAGVPVGRAMSGTPRGWSRRGRRRGRGRALLWCALVAAWELAWGQLRYSVPEEMQKGSFVGDVAKDLGLEPAALRARGARVVSEGRRQYFALHDRTGHLVTAERIDREQVCGRLEDKCLINLEILVEFSMRVFKLQIEITDLNDNAPKFQQDKLQFRISELTAVGTRYSLEEAQDADAGLNALQRYELSGDEHFGLAVQTGPDGEKQPELVLAKALDREEGAFHELVLRAEDGGEPARTGTARIRVVVLDANDNAPVFSQAVYTVRVREDVPVGSALVTVRATDADDGLNGEVKYSLKKSTDMASEIFKLDPETGAITLVRSLDFEEGDSYELGVQARDGGGLSDRAKVVIAVTDVNDNAPEIAVRSLLSAVSEDSAVGTVVALLHVQDRDSGANGEVRLSLGAGLPFRLRSSLGSYYSVVTARELDREEVSEYNVTVRATDGGSPALWSSAVLPLRVLDVNDNAPVFGEARYSAWLPENNGKGALVLRVRAADADWGQNGRVRYRLCEGQVRGAPLSSYVSVHAETGALYALRSFDYEEVREVGLWVRAEDGGAPALSSNVSVRLFIVDENDNAPQVLYPAAAAGAGAGAGWSGVELAPRSAEPGTLVAKVVAVDADSGQNAWLSYELAKATEPGLFRVGLHSGEVRTARAVAERDAARQRLVVLVRDSGQPPRSSTVTLSLALLEGFSDAFLRVSEEEPAADADAPLTLYLIICLASVSALFLATVTAIVVMKVRRARGRKAETGPVFPKIAGEGSSGSLPRSYVYDVCLTAGTVNSEFRFLRPLFPCFPAGMPPGPGDQRSSVCSQVVADLGEEGDWAAQSRAPFSEDTGRRPAEAGCAANKVIGVNDIPDQNPWLTHQ